MPDRPDALCAEQLRRLAREFRDRAYLALSLRRRPGDQLRLHELSNMAAAMRVATVATNDVLFHSPERRMLQDVVTCIREGVTIDDAGFRRERHADRHLKRPAEMARLFARWPEAVARSIEIAGCVRFSLDDLAYQYPDETSEPGLTAQQTLTRLTWEGAAWRYPEGIPDKIVRTLEHELHLIDELGYAPYFLTVHAIVRFARSRGILCQGRGSAANSAVCFVLGITAIDPERHDLLFERFVSQERREPPDIDVDFEHERREEVIQWIYETYGRDRAALCATVIRYRARGAVREVGKALGLPADITGALASQVSAWSREIIGAEHAAELNLNLDDRRLRLTLDLARQLIGTPRHLSTHPGGFVLTRDRLDELVPIEPAAMAGRAVIEWDKDDIAALNFMKVDVLGLGMLGCSAARLRSARTAQGDKPRSRDDPGRGPRDLRDDPARPTRSACSRSNCARRWRCCRASSQRTFYDLVIEVAIVRPGPIQGDMVHPYLRRREGIEPVEYPKPELRQVLGKTLGVPLFQEQAMRVAIECAGFTAGEADRLRRSMATFKHTGGVSQFRDKLVAGMVANGYAARLCREDLRAARRLRLVRVSGKPRGLVRIARLCIELDEMPASGRVSCRDPECAADGVLCPGAARARCAPSRGHGAPGRCQCLALGLHAGADRSRRASCRAPRPAPGARPREQGCRRDRRRPRRHSPFGSIDELWRRAAVPIAALERLADADAFRPSLGLARREAVWAIRALRDRPLPLFEAAEIARRNPDCGGVRTRRRAAADEGRARGGRGLQRDRADPAGRIRSPSCAGSLRPGASLPCAEAAAARDGRRLTTSGLVLVRQRPGSAQRRVVHHDRGRDRHRQHRRLARSVRKAAPGDPVRRHDRGCRPGAARGRGRACDRTDPHRSIAPAAQRRRAR